MAPPLKRLIGRLQPDWVREKRHERALAERAARCPLPGGKSIRRKDGGVIDHLVPLDDPVFVAGKDAVHIEADDAILGFEAEGQWWAISWDVMAGAHVANLLLEGRPYVIGFCDACVGAGLWSAELNGRRSRFQFEGIWEGTPYAIDDNGGLWRLVTMEPLYGEALEHGPLPRFPLVYTTWSEWLRLHPDTLVVDHPGEPDGSGHGWRHRWPGHDTIPKMAARRTNPADPRLDPVALVLATAIDGHARAYPIGLLHREGGIVLDEVGGAPIAAIALPGTYLAMGLRREVDGRALTLAWDRPADAVRAAVDSDGELEIFLVDAETGTRWNLFGHGVEGPLSGRTLSHVWGGLQKWFQWSNLNAGGEVWGVDEHLGGPAPADWDSGVEEVGDQRTAIHLAGGGPGQHDDHAH